MSSANDDYRNLTGMQKAAIFMLAIGNEHSAQLFSKMDEQEIRDLSVAMATLGEINASVVERLFVEFADQLSSAGGLIGTMTSTERLLLSALDPDQVALIMEDMRGPAGRTMWDKLGHVNEAVLANYLKNEYPQTVAVVLSKLKPDHASRVLAVLPENFSTEVMMRMLRMEAVQKGPSKCGGNAPFRIHDQPSALDELRQPRTDGGYLQQPGPGRDGPVHDVA